MEATYRVDGMTCGGCVGAVERALTAALPDTTVVVSLAENTATISGAHDPEAVQTAVEDAGFDFGGPSS